MNWKYFLKKWINLEFFIKTLLAAILDAILPCYQFFSKIPTPCRPPGGPGGRPAPPGGRSGASNNVLINGGSNHTATMSICIALTFR